jgi:hypothetical protein
MKILKKIHPIEGWIRKRFICYSVYLLLIHPCSAAVPALLAYPYSLAHPRELGGNILCVFCTNCIKLTHISQDLSVRWTVPEVKLRPTVSRPVRLGVRHPSGTRDLFFFLLQIFFRQLWVCYFVESSLTRRQDCNLLLLLVSPVQSQLGLSPAGLKTIFIVPILETPPTWRARSPYLYSPITMWPRYTPEHWIPFPSPLTTRRATVEVFYPASTREWTVPVQSCLHLYNNNKHTAKLTH